MVQPSIPFGRFATLTSLASLPAMVVFGGLAATGRLGWGIAAISALICTAMLGYMVRRGLGDVYRVLQFSDTLARGGTGDLPAPFPACGLDPTADALECDTYGGCP